MCERTLLLLEGAQALPVCPDKSVIDMNTIIEHRWNDTNGKCEELGECLVLLPIYPPRISHGMTLESKPGCRAERPETNR